MKVFYHTDTLEEYILEQKSKGKTIGLAPTMGALHNGHFALIKRACKENDIGICSIYVNPRQFNVRSDLDNYPRTLQKDMVALKEMDCDVLFAPTDKEIYPDQCDHFVEVDLAGLDTTMEGAHRPGHFEGVVQVVQRLIQITSCDQLYMGQKDFQQYVIIRHMVATLQLDTTVVLCPIIREEDGLALSSRNVRLLPELRENASILYRVLMQAKIMIEEDRSPIEVTLTAMDILDVPGYRPEYFQIVDGLTLKKASSINHDQLIIACTAVWAGDVRLIDNIILTGSI